MPSFWKSLEHDLAVVGKDALAVAPIVGSAVGIVNPVLGTLITGLAGRITASITSVEQTVTEAKAGQLKSQTVIDDFNNALGLAQEITGKTITFDQAALQNAINAQVAALNAFASLKSSIKTT